MQRGIECVEFAAGAPTLMMGKQLPDIASGLESGMYRYPIGVIGGITPFNFPMMVPCWMFPLAIACGNTFVLKPSERTPILAARLAELFEEAGLPKGVLNIVHGAHDVVNGLIEHQKVKAISFVGSQPVAEYVYKKAQIMANVSKHLQEQKSLHCPQRCRFRRGNETNHRGCLWISRRALHGRGRCRSGRRSGR